MQVPLVLLFVRSRAGAAENSDAPEPDVSEDIEIVSAPLEVDGDSTDAPPAKKRRLDTREKEISPSKREMQPASEDKESSPSPAPPRKKSGCMFCRDFDFCTCVELLFSISDVVGPVVRREIDD